MSASPRREALVAEIDALRERLGEPPLEASGGVSGRNVTAIVDLVRRLGIEEGALRQGVSLDLETARRPNAWISWSEFNALLERIRELGDDRATLELGRLALESPLFRAVGVAAGAFVSERALFEWVARVVWRQDGLYFRGVDAEVVELAPGELHVSWRGRGPVTFSRGFALAMQGIVRELPRLVGRDPCDVELLEDGPGKVLVHVRLTDRPRRGLRDLLLRLPSRRSLEDLRALYTELVETNQLLQEKLTALDESRSARRALERRLEQRRRAEMLGRFAATLQHELNNLLTVVLNHAQFLELTIPADDPRRSDVDVVRSAAERAADLARELRRFDLHGRIPESPVDLHAVVEEAQPLLASALGDGIELEVVRGGSPATVQMELARAEQVVTNLVLNAREAMPNGGRVRVETRVEEVSARVAATLPPLEPGPHARLSVRDDGPGIPEELRRRIFEPFYTTKTDGHGLGLATVYAAVTAAGGAIVVESEPGGGARFEAWLPLAEAPSEPARPPTPGPARAVDATRALVIEDHPMLRAATERILASAGYRVRAAEHGAAALQLVDDGLRPDVVVSDVVMPGIRGAALARALRERAGPLPILFVSGYPERALDEPLGPDTAYLAKPYRPAELIERVAALLADAREVP